MARGGSVTAERTAGALRSELSASEVLGPLVLLPLGIWPWSTARSSPFPVVLLVAFGGILLLISYSVVHWAWLPVGFEAAPLVWAVCGVTGAVCLLAAAVVGLLRRRNTAISPGRAENVV